MPCLQGLCFNNWAPPTFDVIAAVFYGGSYFSMVAVNFSSLFLFILPNFHCSIVEFTECSSNLSSPETPSD